MQEQDLDKLFSEYRAACPEVEPGPNFMPGLWARIEGRSTFWPAFERLSRVVLAICATACVVLLMLDVRAFRGNQSLGTTYVDALASEQNAETAYYAETAPFNALASPELPR
jgi:hypothetical protein